MTIAGTVPSGSGVNAPRCILVGAVLASGCMVHGGPTVGWRPGRGVSVGWHAGVGLQSLELVGGESVVDGTAFAYVGGSVWTARRTMGLVDDATMMANGMIGAGRGDRGVGYVVGAEGAGFTGADPHRSHWGVGVTLGVRLLRRELEVYTSAQVMGVTGIPREEHP